VPEIYITLEEAAELEGIRYNTLIQRMQRTPKDYLTKAVPRESGGKDMVLVSVCSLSSRAKKAYRAAQKVETMKQASAQAEPPWYTEVDLSWYLEQNKTTYYEAVHMAGEIEKYLAYTGRERTAFAERTALDLGVSPQTFYRLAKQTMEAGAWAAQFEQESGENRDYFKILCLCRKPREKATFPSLTPEMRALIENICFHKGFAANIGTVEMLYEAFEERGRGCGWEPLPSCKTVSRYVKHLMESPGGESAHYLAANGLRAWKNKKQMKGKRDSTTLEVMEYVVADAHTFDFWVSCTAPNGAVKAIRPVLVAWIDQRSRKLLGCVLCEHSNTQTVKESFVKMVYEAGCVPKHVHTDNGKDFANHETLGQDRTRRALDTALMDAEFKGFYLAMGSKDWSRSLPYQPWDKSIERSFNTLCSKFSKWFKSYTGTLTGSKTEAKRQKPIQQMLERGELLTMEETLDQFTRFLTGKYETRTHRGLKDSGDQWHTPGEVWTNAPRHDRPAPPREYAAILLMKPDRAKVTNQGITKFKTLYTAPELANYGGQWVNVRWDVDNITKLYIYDKEGRKVCEAYSAELLQFGDRVSQEALERLKKMQNGQLAHTRSDLAYYQTPYELRENTEAAAAVVGKLDLMIGKTPKEKVIALPQDKEFRSEMASKKQRSTAGDEFLASKANEALERIRAIGE